MGPPRLLAAGVPGELYRKRMPFIGRQPFEHGFDVFDRGKFMQPAGAPPDFTGGLRAAEQEHPQDGLFGGAKLQLLGHQVAVFRHPGVGHGSTECSSCRMQMEDGAGKRTLHPVQYLALAYGLMPELAARLKEPVRERVLR